MENSITQEIAELFALVKVRNEQKAVLEATEKLIDPKEQEFLNFLKPFVLKGIRAYNTDPKTTYVILKDGLHIGLSLSKMTISADVRMRCGQHEVDEDFGSGDVSGINKKFASFVDPILRENNTPFTFGGIHVPSSYYMK